MASEEIVIEGRSFLVWILHGVPWLLLITIILVAYFMISKIIKARGRETVKGSPIRGSVPLEADVPKTQKVPQTKNVFKK